MTMTITVPDQDAAKQSAIDALDKFAGLSARVHQALREQAHIQDYRDGDLILREGEQTRAFYVVIDGKVTLFRDNEPDGEEQVIKTLEPGSIFGELALVDGAARSLSARASGAARLLTVDPDAIEAMPDGDSMLTELKACFSVATVRRMRELTDSYVVALEHELQAARTQQEFGQFFVYTLGVMALGTLVNNALARHLVHVNIYTQSFAWEYLLVLLLPSLVVIRKMGITPSEMGLTRKGLGRSLIAGTVVTVVFAILTEGLAAILRHYGELPGRQLPFDWGGMFTYLFHSFLQELVARGFMQNAFQRFLNDERGIKSVLLTSVLFGLFHLQFGFTAVIIVMLSSVGFGMFYLRDRNIAGVTMIHFTLGVCAFTAGLL